MSFAGIAEIVLQEKVGPDHYMMRVYAPELTRAAKPGQFVHVRCTKASDPLLRRPVSLHDIDYEHGTVSLLYQVAGQGTRLLAEMKTGDEIDIMGPLGRGFWVPEGIANVLVIGGGIGVAPLFPLVRAFRDNKVNPTVLLGARTADYVIGIKQLSSMGVKVEVATDDGSLGHRGFVTELAENYMKLAKPDYFYACGPNPMLKQLLKAAGNYGLDGQVSLEERMGCGVGACLACVCKAKTGGDQNAEGFEYKKVCNEGPVFRAGEVIIDG